MICAVFGFSAAIHVHAGFFTDMVKFLSGAETLETPREEKSAVATISLPLLGSYNNMSAMPEKDAEDVLSAEPILQVTQDNALIGLRNPLGAMYEERKDQIVVYTVRQGDTPSGIAARFGISLNTLLWANNIKNSNTIKSGDELIILPVSGVHYEVKKGDTIDGIAKKFKADAADVLNFNGLSVSDPLEVGMMIIIPDGELSVPASARASGITPSRFASLPNYTGYYIRPINGGRKSRGMHGYNGIDLANSCGLPVFASAEGTIILSRTSGWNGGYGQYLVITHPNGTQTLYAHMSAISIATGQKASRGDVIGLIGSTGNSTGCHLHFEIRGAKNPF